MPVRLFLLGDDGHVLDAEAVGETLDAFQAGTVQRGVDELQLINAGTVADVAFVKRVHVVVKALFGNIRDRAVSQTRVEVLVFHTVKDVDLADFVQNRVGHFQADLAAVRSVDLVAVVFGRIVGGGDADANAAVMVAGRPAEERDRLKAGIQHHFDAVRGKHGRGFAGEEVAVDAAVMGNRGHLRQVGRVQMIREALRGAAHDVNIHAVRAGAEDAAQTARTEFKIAVKAFVNFRFIASNGFEIFAHRAVIGFGKPFFIFFDRIHKVLQNYVNYSS